MLQIRTLGSLSVFDGERLVSGAAQQPRRLAILALLARAGVRGVSRDRLLLLLWPEADEERGRRGLNQALYALRQDLGGEDVILGSKDLRLNPERIESDVVRFLDARASGRPEEAAAIWGGPFLDGFNLSGVPDFERWMDEERAALAHDYAETLEALATTAENKGDTPGAVTWWRKLAALDALNARIAESLIRSLVKAGDAPAALRHIEVHSALRHSELGLGPEPALVRLSERIRKGELTAPLRLSGQHPVVEGPALFAPPVMEAPKEDARRPGRLDDSTPGRLDASTPGRLDASAPGWRVRRWVPLALGGAAVAVVALWAIGSRAPGREDAGGEGPLIAVGRIQDFTNDGSGSTAPLGEMLATNLARASGVSVVSTSRLYEVLQQLEASGDSSAGALATAARRAGATELVEGALYRVGQGEYRLDLRRIDMAQGRVIGARTVRGRDLFALADSGTVLLVQTLGGAAPVGGLASVTTQSETAYRLYDAGLRAKARGELTVAREMFTLALRDDSTFAMAAFQLGRLEPDARRAMELMRRAMRLSEGLGDRDRLTIRAGWGFQVSDPSFLAVSETLSIRFPTEVTGHYWRAQALTRDRRYAEAVPVFERVIAMDSLGLTAGRGECVACDAFDGLRYALVALDSLDAAERVLRRWIAASPTAIRPLLTLTETYSLLRRGDAANRALDQAEKYGLSGLELSLRRWAVAFTMEDFPRADSIMLSVRGMGTLPQQADARYQQAMSLRAESRYDEAIAGLREGRALVRREAPATGLARAYMMHEAQALIEARRGRAAIALLDTLTRLRDPLEPPLTTTRGAIGALALSARAHADLGDTLALRRIADSLDVLVASDPGLSRSRMLAGYARAMYLATAGRRDEAIALLERLRFSPTVGFVGVEVALAEQLIAAGRGAEAAAVIEPTLRGYRDAGGLFATAPSLRALRARADSSRGKPAPTP